jgi:hypothetical protein
LTLVSVHVCVPVLVLVRVLVIVLVLLSISVVAITVARVLAALSTALGVLAVVPCTSANPTAFFLATHLRSVGSKLAA